MVLVDDSKTNIQGIENAGGYGVLFNPDDSSQSLEDTVKDTIEHVRRM